MRPDFGGLGARCGTEGDAGCEICRDEAVIAQVVALLDDGVSAQVRADGREFEVAVDLVENVRPGDRLLVHLGVAIARLEEA